MRPFVIALCLALATSVAAKKKKPVEKEPPNRLPRADVTKPGEDLSAHRIDADVWGWSKDYKKMGVIGSDVKRTEDGAHRGWTFVMVFEVGSTEPEFKVISTRVTQAALPHNPEPLYDVRDRMWSVEYNFQRTYPKRCKLKQPRGAMSIEPIWELIEDDGACTPAVGFLMKWKGQTRYQPHQRMKLAADCELMRYTDHRTYWGKKDIGAVMIRFDWGPPKNEASVRFPLAASWQLGRALKLAVHGSDPRAVRDQLMHYGKVEVSAAGPEGHGWQVQYGADDLVYLAHRIAAQIKATVSKTKAPEGLDILVARTATAAESPSTPQPWQEPTEELDEPSDECGGLLRDCGR